MKYLTCLLATMGLFMGTGALASQQHPIGLGMVVTTRSKDYKLGVSYDLLSVGGKSSDVKLNLGGQILQTDNRNLDRLCGGPMISVDYKQVFAGITYECNKKSAYFSVGLKF